MIKIRAAQSCKPVDYRNRARDSISDRRRSTSFDYNSVIFTIDEDPALGVLMVA